MAGRRDSAGDSERYSPVASHTSSALPDDPVVVAASCLGDDGLVNVPSTLRVQVWKCLLGCVLKTVSLANTNLYAVSYVMFCSAAESADDEYLCDRIISETQDLPNQRVVRMDAVRVRGCSAFV